MSVCRSRFLISTTSIYEQINSHWGWEFRGASMLTEKCLGTNNPQKIGFPPEIAYSRVPRVECSLSRWRGSLSLTAQTKKFSKSQQLEGAHRVFRPRCAHRGKGRVFLRASRSALAPRCWKNPLGMVKAGCSRRRSADLAARCADEGALPWAATPAPLIRWAQPGEPRVLLEQTEHWGVEDAARIKGGGWNHLPDGIAGERISNPGAVCGREWEAERRCEKGGPTGTAVRARMSVSPGLGRLLLGVGGGGALSFWVFQGSAAASVVARCSWSAPVAGGGRRGPWRQTHTGRGALGRAGQSCSSLLCPRLRAWRSSRPPLPKLPDLKEGEKGMSREKSFFSFFLTIWNLNPNFNFKTSAWKITAPKRRATGSN